MGRVLMSVASWSWHPTSNGGRCDRSRAHPVGDRLRRQYPHPVDVGHHRPRHRPDLLRARLDGARGRWSQVLVLTRRKTSQLLVVGAVPEVGSKPLLGLGGPPTFASGIVLDLVTAEPADDEVLRLRV